jgi:uncharacterized protein (DUF983 family)
MKPFEIQRPDGPERGILVRCSEHGEQEEYRPGYQRVAFYCPGCGIELDVRLHDADDWRDWGERC